MSKYKSAVHGPVLPKLYDRYKEFGWKPIQREDLNKSVLNKIEEKLEEKTILLEEIMNEYFILNTYQLERLVHEEEPWLKARKGLSADDVSSEKIKPCWIKEYYSSFLSE